jgi:hypothetical protein
MRIALFVLALGCLSGSARATGLRLLDVSLSAPVPAVQLGLPRDAPGAGGDAGHPYAACLMSMMIPGLGQVAVNNDVLKGVAIAGVFVGGFALVAYGDGTHEGGQSDHPAAVAVGGLLALGSWGYGMWDAFHVGVYGS